MGTRNLTMVISGGKTKIAQYGQWDGYPAGQGATILDFLKNNNLNFFKEKLQKTRFQNKKDENELQNFLVSIGSDRGWMNSEQAELYHKKYPLLTRDNGANILNLINDSDLPEYVIVDSSDFVTDGLFCEWWYKVDLDNMILEVYDGDADPLGSYNINNLPDENVFIKEMEDAHNSRYEDENEENSIGGE